MMSRRVAHWLAIAVVAAVGTLAAADTHAAEPEAAVTERLINEVIKRIPLKALGKLAVASTRRAVSIGPLVGGGFATATPVGAKVAEGSDTPVLFGLSAMYFNNRILDVAMMQAMAKKVLRERYIDTLGERVLKHRAARAAENPVAAVKAVVKSEASSALKLTRADYEAVADEVWVSLRDDIMDQITNDDTMMPGPRFGVWAEAARLRSSDAWQLHAAFGYGISKVTIGPTLGVHLGSSVSVSLGAEMAASMFFGRGPRPWHLQLFGRYEYFFIEHASFGHQAGGGLRWIIDVL
jgi:hypothetical protein